MAEAARNRKRVRRIPRRTAPHKDAAVESEVQETVEDTVEATDDIESDEDQERPSKAKKKRSGRKPVAPRTNEDEAPIEESDDEQAEEDDDSDETSSEEAIAQDAEDSSEDDKPVRRSRKDKGVAQAGSADKALDRAEEEAEQEDGQKTILFESKKKMSENGLRIWADRKKLIKCVSAAGSYTSTSVSAPRYMSEITIEVRNEESDDDPTIVFTGESEFDAGEFFLREEDFDTSFEIEGGETFDFFVNPQFLLTALDIIQSSSVTLELVPEDSGDDDEATAALHVLDATNGGQNTSYIVTIPDDDNRPHVPDGMKDEYIEFMPDTFLDAYSEAERCRDSNIDNGLDQVFSSIHTEDDRPYIRFTATNDVHVAMSRAWLDQVEGEKLKKFNFDPAAVAKALPHMHEGTTCQLAVSIEDNPEQSFDWDDEGAQQQQTVVLRSLDAEDRTLSTIRLSTLVPTGDDFDAMIVEGVSHVLDSVSIAATVDYAELSKAISNADKIHALSPESEDRGSRMVYLVLDDGEITVRSHNVSRGDFGTTSTHGIEEIDSSGKHNDDYGVQDVVGIVTNYSLPIFERFNPNDEDDSATVAFFRAQQFDDDGKVSDSSEHFVGLCLLRTDEAEEWNQDDEYPPFVTIVYGAIGDDSIYGDNDGDADDE